MHWQACPASKVDRRQLEAVDSPSRTVRVGHSDMHLWRAARWARGGPGAEGRPGADGRLGISESDDQADDFRYKEAPGRPSQGEGFDMRTAI